MNPEQIRDFLSGFNSAAKWCQEMQNISSDDFPDVLEKEIKTLEESILPACDEGFQKDYFSGSIACHKAVLEHLTRV